MNKKASAKNQLSDDDLVAAVEAAYREVAFLLNRRSDARQKGYLLRRLRLMEAAMSTNPEDVPNGKQWLAYEDAKGKDLVAKAYGDEDSDADAALCGIAAQFVEHGREMPHGLRLYTQIVLMKRLAARGDGRRHANFMRDESVVNIVRDLEKRGFHPTRSSETEISGCIIACKVLARVGIHISEKGVEKIWANRDVVA